MFPRTSNELSKNTSQVTGNTTRDALDTLLAAIGAIYQIPSGTVMLFVQAAAPVGWTKSTTQNDKALRIVSGSGGGTGGSSPFSTVFGKTATDNHTLTSTQMPNHNHLQKDAVGTPTGSNVSVAAGGLINNQTGTTATDAAGSSGAHNHGMDIRVQYVDSIICTKD